MPQSFSYDLTLAESPTKAQARLRQIVTEQMLRSADMSSAHESSDSMAFRPRWGWPLFLAGTRRIRGEKIDLTFRASDLGTTVVVAGKVAGHAQQVASREFWTRTLTLA
jgi:hypothetical protein